MYDSHCYTYDYIISSHCYVIPLYVIPMIIYLYYIIPIIIFTD